MKPINAGDFRHRIEIYETTIVKDSAGFQTRQRNLVLRAYAKVKTTRGMTIIRNNSDFEKAYTNFTIRCPQTALNRDMEVEYHGKVYTIEYLSNVDENGVFIEMQCKEVTH